MADYGLKSLRILFFFRGFRVCSSGKCYFAESGRPVRSSTSFENVRNSCRELDQCEPISLVCVHKIYLLLSFAKSSVSKTFEGLRMTHRPFGTAGDS